MNRLTAMRLLAFAPSAILIAAAVVSSSCATTGFADKQAQVRVFNLYGRGLEVPLPRTLEGCEPLGSVSATAPEYLKQTTGSFEPRDLLPVIRSRAARKSADTVLVSFEPKALQREPRTLRGTAFRCGTHPLPPELGEPLK
jgi:hypothetical protein